MHNDTPFGMTMYLKELDRQAAPKSSALRSEAQRSRRGTTFRDSSVALLRRVGAIVSGTTSMGAPNSRRSLRPAVLNLKPSRSLIGPRSDSSIAARW